MEQDEAHYTPERIAQIMGRCDSEVQALILFLIQKIHRLETQVQEPSDIIADLKMRLAKNSHDYRPLLRCYSVGWNTLDRRWPFVRLREAAETGPG